MRFQVAADGAFKPPAHRFGIRLGNVGEPQQQPLPAGMRDRPARQCFNRKPGGLSALGQCHVADAVGKSRDQMHAARLEIHLHSIAEHSR